MTTLLLLGGLGLLASALLIARLLIPDSDRSPGRRAIVHWIPIAVLALVAAALRHPEIAMGVIFGTSIAVLSSVAGFLGASAPVVEIPTAAQRIWPFLPVPALLAFLVGLSGNLGVIEMALLAMQGLLMALIWQSPVDAGEDVPIMFHRPRARVDAQVMWLAAELVLIVALAVLAAWVITRGIADLGEDARYPAELMGSTLLSILLAVPMISSGTPPALAGQGWVPLTAQAGVVLLNVGALLPAVIGISGGLQWIDRLRDKAAATQPIVAWMVFPRLSWRIDSLALVLMCLVFIPLADGKLRLDRRLAACLIFAYCVYLILAMWNGLRL